MIYIKTLKDVVDCINSFIESFPAVGVITEPFINCS